MIGLYTPTKMTIPSKMKLPKILLNKFINNEGITNQKIHITNNIVINPRTKLVLFSEKLDTFILQ
jgi:hypothetical protein